MGRIAMTLALVIGIGLATEPGFAVQPSASFRAGAHAIDITPQNFPVIVNAMSRKQCRS